MTATRVSCGVTLTSISSLMANAPIFQSVPHGGACCID
jgi:hypothetical protein